MYVPRGGRSGQFCQELEDIVHYLEENAKDFIQFKASLLVKEAANDPIKRADTVRDIVHSIAKIPDRIKKEIYIQECAQIMNISEAVLFNTLAQISKKDFTDASKKAKQEQKAFDVVKNDPLPEKVDVYCFMVIKKSSLKIWY